MCLIETTINGATHRCSNLGGGGARGAAAPLVIFGACSHKN